MWKPEHRLAADRRGLRYPSYLTDAELAIVARARGRVPTITDPRRSSSILRRGGELRQ
jgi:hypothetical protein